MLQKASDADGKKNDYFLVDLMIGNTGLIGGHFDSFNHPQNIASYNEIEYDGIGIM